MTKVSKILGLPAALSVLGAPVFIHTSNVCRADPPLLAVHAYASTMIATIQRPSGAGMGRILIQPGTSALRRSQHIA